MKLATVINTVEKSEDLQDEESFSIAVTAKTIEVLSSQIYKDAHLAIVRELGTNAADSHIEAGKRDLPFDVTLPTALSPELVIRDYGVGMAYKKVMTLYRTYFGSDKTNSNELTGCLGLGSKSPLAYTDQFNLTSWHEGEKSIYTIYKNDKGLPAINRVFYEASNEPNGVEVKIAIKRQDFETFAIKARDVYQWFTPRPNVKGIDNNWLEEEIEFKSDNWAIRQNKHKNMTVVMGNVAYHVDNSDLSPVKVKLDRAGQVLCGFGPILRVNIGDVDIAASRETLKFDGPKTYPAITALMKKMALEVKKMLQDDIDACKTFWDARKHYHFLNHSSLSVLLGDKIVWQNLDVNWRIPFKRTNSDGKIDIYATARKYWVKQTKSGMSRVTSSEVTDIIAERNTELFIVDSKKHISRIKYYTRNLPHGSSVYLLQQAPLIDPAISPNLVVKPINDFFKNQHLVDVVQKTSDLADPDRIYTGSRSPTYQILKPKDNHFRSSHWSEASIDFDKGGIYVEVVGNTWSAGPSLECRAAELFDLDIVPLNKLVGVRKKPLADFEASDKWVRMDQYIVDKYENHHAARASAVKADVFRSISCTMKQCHELLNFDTDYTGLFGKLCRKLKDYSKANDSALAKAYYKAMPYLGTTLDITAEVSEMKKMYQTYEHRYPLLRHVHIGNARKEVLQYVSLIDGIKLSRKLLYSLTNI